MEIEKIKNPPQPKGGFYSENLVKNFRGKNWTWSLPTHFRGGPRRRSSLQIVLWSWVAILIDFLILIAASCVFILVFAKTMNAPISQIYFQALHSHGFLKAFVGVFVVNSWFYQVLSRGFFGHSMGEWACRLRVGRPSEENHKHFIFRVILRASLIVATGLVTLPLLSIFFRQDLAGKITGLKLFSFK